MNVDRLIKTLDCNFHLQGDQGASAILFFYQVSLFLST